MTNSQTHASALPFNGLHSRNPCNYVDYYSFTDSGRLCGGTYQGKSTSQRPTP